jgi:hypothetical protein
MKRTILNQLETDDLIALVQELKSKLKRKHQHLTTAKLRLQKLQGIVVYQRERILELYKEQIPLTREIINSSTHDQKLY